MKYASDETGDTQLLIIGRRARSCLDTISKEPPRLRTQATAHSLEVLESRIAPAGVPTLDSFSVAGINLSPGGAIIAGPSQDIWVQSQFSNTAGDNIGHGGVTLSFPGVQYFSDPGISLSSDFTYSSDDSSVVKLSKQRGDSINTASGATTASHIMFEGDDTTWDGTDFFNDEEHIIAVQINTGTVSKQIKATVRATMGDANWSAASIVRSPTSGSANGD